MVFVYNDVCFTSIHYSLNNSIQEKSNNPDVLAAGPLKLNVGPTGQHHVLNGPV